MIPCSQTVPYKWLRSESCTFPSLAKGRVGVLIIRLSVIADPWLEGFFFK